MIGFDKDVTLGKEAREKIIEGVDILANAVKATLGPKGRNVIIQGELFPRVTKDGVTVAKSIQLKDPLQNLGCTVVKQASQKTNDLAGDGTTTSTVLAQALVREGNKLVTAGEDPVQLKREMDEAAQKVIEYLKKGAVQIKGDWDKVRNIATISANNDQKIGDIITEAFKMSGEDGVILVDQAKTTDIYLEQKPGMEFSNGMASPYFATDVNKMMAEYEDAYVLLYDGKISSPKGFEPLLDSVVRTGKPLLILADEIDPQTMNILVVNKLRAGFKVIAAKSPGFGQRRKKILEDIAIMTGGQVISQDYGFTIDKASIDHLGKVKKVKSTLDTTTLVEGYGDPKLIEERIKVLHDQIDLEETGWGKDKVKERIAKLGKGIVIVRVGAPTDVEVGEIKDRIDDALKATRAALQEGIVPGGGTALINAIKRSMLDSSATFITPGGKLLSKACESPLKSIVDNAGKSGDAVVERLLDPKKVDSYGYNALTNQYEDLLKAGVIDPAKVVRVALENAVSVAGMIITTECAVTTVQEEPRYDPQMITP